MSDEDAYMALALNNAQGELNAVERGMRALHAPMGVREYARAVGRGPDQISRERHAAEVLAYANTPSSPALWRKDGPWSSAWGSTATELITWVV
jgi:hypothetical protein